MKILKSILSVAAVVACLIVTAEANPLTSVSDTTKMSKMDHKMGKKGKMSKMHWATACRLHHPTALLSIAPVFRKLPSMT